MLVYCSQLPNMLLFTVLSELNVIWLQFYIQQFFYDMSVSKSFELLLMAVAFLNLCTMAFNYYRKECLAETVLDILNIAFITFFALEAVIKIIGLRMSYFKDSWCLFNFFVVIISALGKLKLNDAPRKWNHFN